MITNAKKIQAILFFFGEPLSVKKLSEYANITINEAEEALTDLTNNLEESGLTVVREGNEIILGTNPELKNLIENITKEELGSNLARAALETLTITLYKNPISKREIDFIRGVNSSYIIRNLMIRGLIERTISKVGERSYFYKPTIDLLSYLGISKIEDLPHYKEFESELNEFASKETKDNNDEQ